MEIPELYFERDTDWYDWLLNNHRRHDAVYLIFYKVDHHLPSMRWKEAVKVAICFGWIDSTVKSLGSGKRQQYFTKRNPKSTWSALNKTYVNLLEKEGLIHDTGWEVINLAKETGKWSEMDDVENSIIPKDLQNAFDKNAIAFENYQNFAKGYQKSYLSWLHSAKREATRQNRIAEIIKFCNANKKTRDNW
ncbi:YdeI/OmpD-associated family protein [Winogradskyella sp. MH6]|uniref:YdeI/OmpD-associated family protein n=1 Tax=Winogradskyella sp. MH6 TaxID=2929510 RepID=UPI001FB4EF1C|nr:YdeI/OmpD-associated family protein [Winogradskyella sp. MH6]